MQNYFPETEWHVNVLKRQAEFLQLKPQAEQTGLFTTFANRVK